MTSEEIRKILEDMKTKWPMSKELIEFYESLYTKIEELEHENAYLKMDTPEQNIEHFRIINENRRKIGNLRAENKQLKENQKQIFNYIIKHTNNGVEYLDVWEVKEILDMLGSSKERDKETTENGK